MIACVEPMRSETVVSFLVALMTPASYTTVAPRRSKMPRSGTNTRPARSTGPGLRYKGWPPTDTVTACASAGIRAPATAPTTTTAATAARAKAKNDLSFTANLILRDKTRGLRPYSPRTRRRLTGLGARAKFTRCPCPYYTRNEDRVGRRAALTWTRRRRTRRCRTLLLRVVANSDELPLCPRRQRHADDERIRPGWAPACSEPDAVVVVELHRARLLRILSRIIDVLIRRVAGI